MAPDTSIVDVVERIQKGERVAEAELVRRFYRRVFSMVLARTGNVQVAEDLTQDVILSVICALRDGKLRNHDGLPGYICGTMRHRVQNYFRSLHSGSVGLLSREPIENDPDPEEALQNAEMLGVAKEALARLSAGDRRILRLTFVDGLSPREISERLGLKGDVIRQRKSRAIRRAREILRERLSRN